MYRLIIIGKMEQIPLMFNTFHECSAYGKHVVNQGYQIQIEQIGPVTEEKELEVMI